LWTSTFQAPTITPQKKTVLKRPQQQQQYPQQLDPRLLFPPPPTVPPPNARDNTFKPTTIDIFDDAILNTYSGLTPLFDATYMNGNLDFIGIELDDNDALSSLSRKHFVIMADILNYKQMSNANCINKNIFSLNEIDYCNIRIFECLSEDNLYSIFCEYSNAFENLIKQLTESSFGRDLLKSSRYGISDDMIEHHPLWGLISFARSEINKAPEDAVFGSNNVDNWNYSYNQIDAQYKKLIELIPSLGKGPLVRIQWAGIAAQYILSLIRDDTSETECKRIIELIKYILNVLVGIDFSILTDLFNINYINDWYIAGLWPKTDNLRDWNYVYH
jgi:hypothetical protein